MRLLEGLVLFPYLMSISAAVCSPSFLSLISGINKFPYKGNNYVPMTYLGCPILVKLKCYSRIGN